tara:strand:- start:1713 stop:2600 length:888 start_codon:yes stop_codon:yes gene_type:complete
MRLLNKTNIDFINRKQYAIFISSVVIIVGMISLFIKGGPPLSIDFTGGTIVQIKFDEAVEIRQIRQEMDQHGFENPQIINFGNPSEILIKLQYLGSNSDLSDNLDKALEKKFDLRRIESVGPKIGKELQTDAIYAILLALILILIYITFRFDRNYALGSMIALIHDILITLSIFTFFNYEIDLSIIAAFLTIVGYSLNDTIVLFDRIRENVPKLIKDSLVNIVNISINETLSRTVITSLTTLIVLFILYLMGGEVIKLFAFALLVGVLAGTYSSIFIASPAMIYFETKKISNKKQ